MPKDQLIKLKEGTARVKPVKNLGKDEDSKIVQAQAIKNPDGSKVVNRYVGGKLVDQNYVPKKMKVKKFKKLKTTRVPRKLKKVEAPSYTAPEVTLDADDLKEVAKRERIANAKKKKKLKFPKIKLRKRPKGRKTKNLVTGKWNYTQ